MNLIDDTLKLQIADDGEASFDFAVPELPKHEKRKRGRRSLLRFAPIVLGLLVYGLVSGYLFTFVFHIVTEAPGHSTKIAYNGYNGMHVVDIITGQIKVTSTQLMDYHRGAVSPDSKNLVFWQEVGDHTLQLWMSSFDGQEGHSMGTYYVVRRQLAWSPDSRYVAFSAYNPNAGNDHELDTNELYILDTVTGAARQLTHNGFDHEQPSWSPDGTQIVFTSTEDVYNHLYHLSIIDVATGTQHIVSEDCFGGAPSWSPDGKLIAFLSKQEADALSQIYVVNVDGSGLKRITNDLKVGEEIAWVP